MCATAAVPLAVEAVQWITVATAGATGLQQIYGIFRDMKSNPGKAKSEALKKCREDSKAQHEKSLATMAELRNKIDEASQKSQEDANRRFKEQQAVNAAAQEAIEKRIKQSEEQYDENMRKMKADHQKQMNELREASKEEREKAMNEHKKKMDEMEKKHDKEKKEASEKLEETKKEGARQIEQANAEVQAVVQERAKALKSYNEAMEILMKANNEQLMLLHKEVLKLKTENSELRIASINEENKTILRQIRSRTDELLTHFQREHSREVIMKFQGVFENVKQMSNHLANVGIKCIEPSSLAPGEIDPDIRDIRSGKSLYDDRVRRYRQFAINAPHAHPGVLQICNQFITDMNKVMQDLTLLQITTHLPKAIDQDSTANIEKYGKMAQEMQTKFLNLENNVQGMLDATTRNFHETNAREIEN